MKTSAWVCFVVVLLASAARCRVLPEDEPDASTRVSLWATRAHDWLLDSACAATPGADGAPAADLCRDLVRVPRAQIRVYAAGRSTGTLDTAEPVMATLVGPEGGKALGPHDAVLVLDPYPAASFGHLVLVFFVALGTTEERCALVRGLRLENGDCVQPAREPRCSPGGGPGSLAGSQGAPCELLFLPLVTPASRPPSQHDDRLQCRSDVPGFFSAPCPPLRSASQVAHLHCDPVSTNARRCDTTQFIRTRCPFMQTCDHAVILSGGWNRHLSDRASLQNVLDFHGMLKHVGFHEDNIKVFFANGEASDRGQEGAEPAMYPSALKLALRYHVHRLCETARCADTLLLYLNGPTLPGGASLLWDADGNGQLDETEMYSARELLRDVSHCGARRVVVVADQSYARDLVRHAAQLHESSRGLRNVVVLAAPGAAPGAPAASAPSWTSHWTEPRHRHACLADLAPDKEADADAVFLGAPSLLNTTLTGMPCGLARDLQTLGQAGLSREQQRLHRRYSGCQNLSTREWMAAQDEDDRQDGQDDEDQDGDDDGKANRSRSENKA